MGGLSAGEGQSGRAGCGWSDPRNVRRGSEEQSVEDLESDVLRVVFSASGEGGGDTQTAWRWDENPWDTDDLGQECPDGAGQEVGVEGRTDLSPHPDSYGYRPYRSALDAVAICRERCWKSDWVIDLDIQKFFDSVDHSLMVKAVRAHADVPCVLLYVKRWLTAPIQLADGTLLKRDRGTPQGSAVSPVLANLFMHYAFDAWMTREYPGVAFERYADDVVVHCVTERQARNLVAAIGDRMEQVGLRLHPDKTKIVYCKDQRRRLDYDG
jgi:Reverse transcriptase (RNA-dependent DNA polymerase)